MAEYEWDFVSTSPEETAACAERLGQVVSAGTVIALSGELGAGKTTWARGFARGLGIEGGVSSPTYTLMQEHQGRLALYHFDAWMEGREKAFFGDGGDAGLYGDGVALVEWAERVAEYLPLPRIEVELFHARGEDGGEARRVRARVLEEGVADSAGTPGASGASGGPAAAELADGLRANLAHSVGPRGAADGCGGAPDSLPKS